MAISNTLNTNEIKNSAGTEQEFEHLRFPDGRSREFKLITEAPARPHRLFISHEEFGTGIKRRRRSQFRTSKVVMSDVDASLPVQPLVYTVVDFPVGALTTDAELKNVLANHISALASTGADTVVKFDCTGTFAKELINGGM